MPSSPANTAVSLARSTKARLDEAKLRGVAYDDLLRALLEAVPPEALRARFEARREAARTRLERTGAPLRRTASKQRLVAAAARERWAAWTARGKVTQDGPRRVTWNVDLDDAAPGGVTIAARRRGPRVP
ncbi:MAG TPA: hypothetical protein VM889_02275 [Candidatus Thermoplasmatota archaeon]|nr:hypothetical protein [Candidatus Thermoplasmatota archaeon]